MYSWQGLIVLAFLHLHLPLWCLSEVIHGLQGKEQGKRSFNASETRGAECMCFFYPECMCVCVPSSGLAGWVGVSQAFAFTRGRQPRPPDTPSVLCMSLLRGWNCTSKVAVEVTYDYLI